MMNLRKISLADSGFFFENLNDPEIKKSYNNIPDKITLDDIKQQINKIKDNCFVIEFDGKPIGMRYFWNLGDNIFDTGSWITKDFRRKGFGSIAFEEFVKKFQNDTIFRMKPKNPIAEKFASRNGFIKDRDGFWYFQNK